MGRRIADRYEIKRLIAQGGMGAVYEAVQHPLGRSVAVKILQPHIGRSDIDRAAFQERFNLEAEALARLSHPNTVTIHDYGQTSEGLWFLVMEYVAGRPLSRLLQDEGPLPAERAIHLMLQVCRALRHAHRRGIVHRDLKPSNLLIQPHDESEEQVKVVDFGLVKLTHDDQSLTREGTILGSPHCMAPEQVKGEVVDVRTDIYAIGVLLFRSISGQYPFHGPTSTATMVAHIQQPLPALADVMPTERVPQGLEPIIRRCLEKDPQERYQDITELVRDLGALVAMPTEEYSSLTSLNLPPPRSTIRGWIALGVGALALVGALGWVLWQSTRPKPPSVPAPAEVVAPATTPVAPMEPAIDLPAAPVETTAEILFTSDPPGAEVLLEGAVIGTTPFRYETRVSGSSDIRRFQFRLDGHEGRTKEQDLATASDPDIHMELPALPVQPQKPTVSRPVPATPTPPVSSEPAPTEKTADGYKTSPYD